MDFNAREKNIVFFVVENAFIGALFLIEILMEDIETVVVEN